MRAKTVSKKPPRRARYQHVFLILCAPCKARVQSALEHSPARDPHTAPRELCDDCTAKAGQALRLLVSDNLDARIAIPWGAE